MSGGTTNTVIASFQNTLTTEAVSQAVKAPAKFPQFSSVVIRALEANAGVIYVGNSEEGNTVSATTGYELKKGESTPALDLTSLGKLFFNGTKTGDKICILAVGP